MAERCPILQQKFTSTNFQPLAGGKLWTYIAGTNTPKATYLDRDEETEHTNPIVLDSDGAVPELWLANGLYKFVLMDENDVVIETWDFVRSYATPEATPGESADNAAASAASAEESKAASLEAKAAALAAQVAATNASNTATAALEDVGEAQASIADDREAAEDAAGAAALSAAAAHVSEVNAAESALEAAESAASIDTEAIEDLIATKADQADLDSHTGNASNPHEVTKAQVGLGDVDNTSDMDKPVSTAQAAADLAALNSAKDYTDSAVGDLDDDVTAALALKAPIASPTFTGGLEVLSTTGALIPPRMTEAQRDAITPLVDGSIIFNSTSGTLQQCKGGTWTDVGSGSGGSGINYVENPDFDENINGVAAYADAAGAAPVDGTGGSPSVTLTHGTVANGWNPLRGKGSLVFGKGASNLQGQGCAIDLEIDPADQGMVLQFTMDYAIAVGTYADGDMQVFLYDKTNSQLIYAIEGQSILKHGLISLEHRARFQTAYNSTSYRLIFHVASTSVSSYSLYFDNLYFGPQLVNRGLVGTDTKPVTMTLGSSSGSITNATVTATETRVGGRALYEGRVTFSGASSSFQAMFINLPSGRAVNTSVAGSSIGQWQALDAGVTLYGISAITLASSTAVALTQSAQVVHSGTAPSVSVEINNTYPFTFGNTDEIRFKFEVPILGWSSNQVLSSDVSGRLILGNAVTGSTQTVPNATWTLLTTILAATGATDPSASWDGTNKRWNIIENGYYKFPMGIGFASNGSGSRAVGLSISGGGVSWVHLWQPSSTDVGMSRTTTPGIYLTAGSTVGLMGYQSSGGALNCINAEFGIEKVSQGSQQIAATEKVRAVANTSAGQSVGTSHTAIAFGTITENTHGCLDATGTTFTCNRNGTLKCTVALMSGATAINAGSAFAATLFKGGTGLRRIAATRPTASATYQYIGAATVSVPCLAGETYSVRAICDNATSLYTASSDNFVEWEIV